MTILGNLLPNGLSTLLVNRLYTFFRDALLTTYPEFVHLMCYFHVVKCCKDNLKRCSRAEQKPIFHDIYYFHCSSSEVDFNEHYDEVISRWRTSVPDFATYFDEQWNTGDEFTNWKIFCSEPGVASTNNALESFKNTIKKSYTFGTRHCLSALFDIILDHLIVDVSLDLIVMIILIHCSARALWRLKGRYWITHL